MSLIKIDHINNIINVELWLIHFVDDGGIHFIHSPNLDLTGYGSNRKEAKESFDVVIKEFFDYTIKNNTLEIVLKKAGWKIEKSENIIPDSNIFSSTSDNGSIFEISKKYPVDSFHESLGIPAYA